MKILFLVKEEDPIDPMNVELLSALAKREGHETFLNVLQHGDLQREMGRIRPDIVAYSGKTGEHKTFLKVNHWIKEQYGDKVFTVMGGPHPTFSHRNMRLYGEETSAVPIVRQGPVAGRHHQSSKVEDTELDALCIGEGDDAWVEMLGALSRSESVDAIPNLVTRESRLIYPEPQLRERRIDLDDLPYYDRELVYDKTFLGGFPMRSFMSSRGCPFRCTYCFNYDWNKTYRAAGKMKKLHNRYSVDRLIAEINDWRRIEKEKGYATTQFIKFYDDMFEFRVSDWLMEFAEKFPREVGLPFFCLIRCDIFAHEEKDGSVKLNEEVLLLLKKAGLQSLSMSIEAGNDFIRENILVRDMTRKEIEAAFALCRKYRVATFANTILGIPAPVIPGEGDPDFDRKLGRALDDVRTVFRVKKQVEPRTLMGYKPETEKLWAELDGRGWSEDLRRRVAAHLESYGLRRSAIDYDIEAVELNVNCGIDLALFPRLDPYPGTTVTDYTIALGAFDGDFEKLHSSYDTTSSFTCFTKEEKAIQDNLSFLGQICCVLPWLWPVSKKWLIYWPLTRLYWLMYLITKTYVIKYRVYPMRFSVRNFFRSAWGTLYSEYKKYFRPPADEPVFAKPKGIFADATPTDILAGRWEE